jgi:hypothetical protein
MSESNRFADDRELLVTLQLFSQPARPDSVEIPGHAVIFER